MTCCSILSSRLLILTDIPPPEAVERLLCGGGSIQGGELLVDPLLSRLAESAAESVPALWQLKREGARHFARAKGAAASWPNDPLLQSDVWRIMSEVELIQRLDPRQMRLLAHA
jgi:hypothetical protein